MSIPNEGSDHEVIVFEGSSYRLIKEGDAKILYEHARPAFYNPVQEFNRDISLLMLRLFQQTWSEETGGKPLHILEGLAATGLRAIRYALELPESNTLITANDIDEAATASISRSARYNKVEHRIRVTKSSITDHLYQNSPSHYAAIDLDPYGSASKFMDISIEKIAPGGLLLVTSTDLAVLCGNQPDACYEKYQIVSMKGQPYTHELALRILLSYVASRATAHRRVIEPLISFFADFYVRIFVRVWPRECKKIKNNPGILHNLAHIFQCCQCPQFKIVSLAHSSHQKKKNQLASKKVPVIQAASKDTQARPDALGPHHLNLTEKIGPVHDSAISKPSIEDPNDEPKQILRHTSEIRTSMSRIPSICETCQRPTKMSGPIWSGALHNPEWAARAKDLLASPSAPRYGTHRRMQGMLSLICSELDTPLFYALSPVASACKMETPKMSAVQNALLHTKHRISLTHIMPNAIKTTAPFRLVVDIVRAWATKQTSKKSSNPIKPGGLLYNEPFLFNPNFEPHPLNQSASDPTEKLLRFPIPPPNWGPAKRTRRQAGTKPPKHFDIPRDILKDGTN